MKLIEKIKRELDFKKGIAMLFFPFLALVITPFRLFSSLYYCKEVFFKRGIYFQFDPLKNCTSFFYWTRQINLSRFGINGISPFLGLGNTSLVRNFHYSRLALKLYIKHGAALIFISLFFWLSIHFLWVQNLDLTFILVVLLITFSSPTFYTQTFLWQNYNVLGWLFLPMILFGLVNDSSIFLFTGILLGGIMSFTVLVINIQLLVFYLIFVSYNSQTLIAFLLLCIILVGYLFPLIKDLSGLSQLNNLGRALGFWEKRKVRYKRQQGNKIDLKFLFFFFVYAQFLIAYYLITHTLPYLSIFSFLVYFQNSLFSRYLDEQSPCMLWMSCSVCDLLISGTYALIPFLWFSLLLIPKLSGFHNYKNIFTIVPIIKSYDTTVLVQAISQFLHPIPQNNKILIAYTNPDNVYNKLFDRQRAIAQVAHYVASRDNKLLLPDELAVNQLNYLDAPDFWSASPSELIKQCTYWQTEYAIIYQVGQPLISPKWEQAGFKVINELNWLPFSKKFKNYNEKVLDISQLKWWLLKTPTRD